MVVDPSWLRDLGDENEIRLGNAFIDDFFRPLVVGGGVIALVRRIVSDDAYLTWCTSQSYIHHNSFTKVVLGQSQSGRRLVWHKWRPTQSELDVEYHNHRWDFVSYIIRGSVRLADFHVGVGDIVVEQYRYASPGESESYLMGHLGMTCLEPASERVVRAGEFYYQPFETVHVAIPIEIPTSTLIIQGGVVSPRTDVFSPRSYASTSRPVDRLASNHITADLLGELQAELLR